MRDSEDEKTVLETFLESVPETSVPKEVEERMQHRLEAFKDRVDRYEERGNAWLRWGSFDLLLKSALIVATTLIILIVAFSVWTGGNRKGNGVAFAQVIDYFRNARSVRYKSSTEMKAEGVPDALKGFLKPTAELIYIEPGVIRQTIGFGAASATNIIDFTNGKGLTLTPSIKKTMKTEFDPVKMDSNHILKNHIQELRNLRDGTEEPLGSVTIDGRSTVCFRVQKEGDIQDATWTVWADPTDGLPIQVRIETNIGGQQATINMYDFAFDEPVDENLFSLEVPDGYTLVSDDPFRMGDLTQEPGEEALVEMLRFFSEKGAEFFPPGLNPISFMVYCMKLEEQDKRDNQSKENKQGPSFDKKDLEKAQQMSMATINMMNFVKAKQAKGDWHYAGEGVRFGDGDTPVAWWKGDDPDTYRVLYGDLTIRNVSVDALPQTSTHEHK